MQSASSRGAASNGSSSTRCFPVHKLDKVQSRSSAARRPWLTAASARQVTSSRPTEINQSDPTSLSPQTLRTTPDPELWDHLQAESVGFPSCSSTRDQIHLSDDDPWYWTLFPDDSLLTPQPTALCSSSTPLYDLYPRPALTPRSSTSSDPLGDLSPSKQADHALTNGYD